VTGAVWPAALMSLSVASLPPWFLAGDVVAGGLDTATV
jgi:hypothetical protein